MGLQVEAQGGRCGGVGHARTLCDRGSPRGGDPLAPGTAAVENLEPASARELCRLAAAGALVGYANGAAARLGPGLEIEIWLDKRSDPLGDNFA